MFFLPILFFVHYINSSIDNVTNPVSIFKYINNSKAFNGTFGFGIDMAIFVLFFFIFSFRIRVADAAAASSFISLIAATLLTAMGVLGPNLFLVNIGLIILTVTASLIYHILHPFD